MPEKHGRFLPGNRKKILKEEFDPGISYNCEEIFVTPAVLKEIRDHYEKDEVVTNAEIELIMKFFGPEKMDGDGYVAEVKEKFIIK